MLKKDIGANAGIIWNHLAKKGKLSIREIGELTNSKDSSILLSLGWLSRENKVAFTEHNGHLHVELNHSPTEMFY